MTNYTENIVTYSGSMTATGCRIDNQTPKQRMYIHAIVVSSPDITATSMLGMRMKMVVDGNDVFPSNTPASFALDDPTIPSKDKGFVFDFDIKVEGSKKFELEFTHDSVTTGKINATILYRDYPLKETRV